MTRAAWTDFATATRRSARPMAPRQKYGAQRQQIDGIWFDSKREAARYQELKLMRAAGLIGDLECHPAFPIEVLELYRMRSGTALQDWRIATVGTFTADFRYIDLRSGEIIVEDVKAPPTRTEAYQLRKKLTEAIHGVTIIER